MSKSDRFWICHACLHDWRQRYEKAGLLGFDDFTDLTLHYPKPGWWWDCQFCRFWPAKWTVRTSPSHLLKVIRVTEMMRKLTSARRLTQREIDAYEGRSHQWFRRPGALTQLMTAVPAMLLALVLFALRRK